MNKCLHCGKESDGLTEKCPHCGWTVVVPVVVPKTTPKPICPYCGKVPTQVHFTPFGIFVAVFCGEKGCHKILGFVIAQVEPMNPTEKLVRPS